MNSDFKDLLAILDRHAARYLVIGGYAVMLYSEPRYTRDIDLFVATAEDDLAKFRAALAEFGFPMTDEAVSELRKHDRMITIGRPPAQIDFLNHVAGLDFEKAWSRRHTVDVDGVAVDFVSLDDLITAKQSAGRPQDLLDLENLRKSKRG